MKYAVTTSVKEKYIWFQLPKAASSSIRKFLEMYTQVDLNTKAEWSRIKYFPRKYKSYFKFTFVRNPFDRLVSCWKDKVIENTEKYEGPEIQYMRENKFSFDKFVNKITSDFWEKNPHWSLQCDMLIDNFETELDFIGKVENFESDMEFVLKRLGVNYTPNEYHSNSTFHKHYTEYYNDELKLLVEKKYLKDIEYFGYDF